MKKPAAFLTLLAVLVAVFAVCSGVRAQSSSGAAEPTDSIAEQGPTSIPEEAASSAPAAETIPEAQATQVTDTGVTGVTDIATTEAAQVVSQEATSVQPTLTTDAVPTAVPSLSAECQTAPGVLLALKSSGVLSSANATACPPREITSSLSSLLSTCPTSNLDAYLTASGASITVAQLKVLIGPCAPATMTTVTTAIVPNAKTTSTGISAGISTMKPTAVAVTSGGSARAVISWGSFAIAGLVILATCI